MEETLDKVYQYIITYGVQLLAALLIFIVGKWVAKAVTRISEQIMIKSKLEHTLIKFLRNFVYFLLMTFVIIAALGRLGIQTASFVAIVGAAGLAVGLALQGSLSNFAAGVMLLIFRPFKVGDFISAGGVLGSVVEISIFTTTLNAPDNRREIVPNAQITGGTITNFTAIEKRRIDLVFGISYTDNMKTAKEALEKVVANDPRILKDPKPVVAVYELGDSSVNLVCRPWVKPTDYWDVYFSVVENGKLELEKNGITIPFPQRDIHVFSENANVGITAGTAGNSK